MKQIKQIKPIDLQDFLVGEGWVPESDELFSGQRLLFHPRFTGAQMNVPVDPTYTGAEPVIEFTLQRYCELTGMSRDEVLSRIAHVRHDVVKISVFGGKMRDEMPVNFAAAIVPSLRLMLRAGYYAATGMRGFGPTGNGDEAYADMFDASVEVDHIHGVSFLFACRLDVPRADVESSHCDQPPPMIRRIMMALHRLMTDIEYSIQEDATTEYFERLEACEVGGITVEFCEALLRLFDRGLNNSVEIRFLPSPHYPIRDADYHRPVHFRNTDVSFFEKACRILASQEKSQQYVGRIVHLRSDRGDGNPGSGSALVSLFDTHGSVTPAHIKLSESDFTAAAAHPCPGIFFRIAGVLVISSDRDALATMTLTRTSKLEFIAPIENAAQFAKPL